MRRSARGILLSLVFASLSFASIVKFPGTTVTFPNGQTNSVSGACVNFAGYTCTTTAYFNGDSLDTLTGGTQIAGLFREAFDAWNDTNAANQKWTLDYGGTLKGTFVVDPATAMQSPVVAGACGDVAGPAVCGGLEIRVRLKDVTLPPLDVAGGDQLVWAQGLFVDYTVQGAIVAPYYNMDVRGDGDAAPPAYPYQYPDNHFYDEPAIAYQPPGSLQGFFNADAYLSVINYKTDMLTVYDGVSYGFQNYVSPEPGTWILLASGLVLFAIGYRRRQSHPGRADWSDPAAHSVVGVDPVFSKPRGTL